LTSAGHESPPVAPARRLAVVGSLTAPKALSSRLGKAGAAICLIVVMIALFGPFVSPESPTETVGVPFSGPSRENWLGTDALGRDVLSRFLHGGRTLVAVAVLATVLSYSVGVTIGMIAGYRRRFVDIATITISDVMIAFPPIIFLLALVAAAGPRVSLAIVGIAAIHAPRVARIARVATIETAQYDFVEAAVARGESTLSVLRRDILPNIRVPILADMGPRLAYSVILFSSLSFLGLGPTPPAADWGLMISENRLALTTQPWAVVGPAIGLALLAIGVTLLADAVARAAGQTVTGRGL
jgi:peptide/nickel transport system permease protein